MNNIFKRSNLVVIAIGLAVAKFALAPLLDWQNTALENKKLKHAKLEKLVVIDKDRYQYQAKSEELRQTLQQRRKYLYADTDQAKIDIQENLEQSFSDNNITIESLRWLAESSESVRRIRLSVRFKGQYKDFLKALWSLAKGPHAGHQFQMNYTLKTPRGVGQSSGFNLISAQGEVGFEFYAVNQSKIERLVSVSSDASEIFPSELNQ
jgi:hypothetical protein